jgi:hypothetical protein
MCERACDSHQSFYLNYRMPRVYLCIDILYSCTTTATRDLSFLFIKQWHCGGVGTRMNFLIIDTIL